MVSKRETSKKMTLWLMFFMSCICLSPALALEISHILGQHPDLSTFSNYLTQTHLAHDIDSLHKITLLVVANSDMGPLSGKPMDEIKKILSAHVLLEHYDLSKLNSIKGRTIVVSSLSSTRINISVSSAGNIIKFQSTGNKVPVKLVRLVEESEPNGVSVVQISAPIMIQSKGAGGAPAHLHSRRVLAESPQQQQQQSDSPSSNAPQQGNHGPPPSNSNPPSQSHAPESPKHSNAPPPSNSQNAPQPTPNSNNKSSPPPASSPDSSESPNPSKKADSPAPAEEDADSPTSDKGDSPSSSSSPSASDSPSSSSSPTASDSPSSAPGDSASSADAEKKHKSSAFGITPPPPAACVAALFISLLIGKLL